jgi:hypothetical protein
MVIHEDAVRSSSGGKTRSDPATGNHNWCGFVIRRNQRCYPRAHRVLPLLLSLHIRLSLEQGGYPSGCRKVAGKTASEARLISSLFTTVMQLDGNRECDGMGSGMQRCLSPGARPGAGCGFSARAAARTGD